MVVNTGDRSGSVAGTRSCASASPDTSPLPSVVIAMMRPRRAFTSCMLDSTLPYTSSLGATRSEEHTSELQSRLHLVCRLLLEKKHHEHPPRGGPPHLLAHAAPAPPVAPRDSRRRCTAGVQTPPPRGLAFPLAARLGASDALPL